MVKLNHVNARIITYSVVVLVSVIATTAVSVIVVVIGSSLQMKKRQVRKNKAPNVIKLKGHIHFLGCCCNCCCYYQVCVFALPSIFDSLLFVEEIRTVET